MSESNQLRDKAVKILKGISVQEMEELTLTELKNSLNELKVHQIELELQNEELRAARSETEKSKKQYQDLYDFAPVGYFSFDKEGIIRRANIFAGKILGAERENLLLRRFQNYITEGYKETFHTFLRRIFVSKERESLEVQITNKSGDVLHLQLEGNISHIDVDQCLVTATDVTEYKKAQSIIKTSLEEKERLQIIVATQDEERRNISEELHNGIAQSLYALQLLFEGNSDSIKKEAKDKILTIIENSIDEIRTLSFELMPHILEEFGLKESIWELCNKKSSPELRILYTHTGEMQRYNRTIEISIYRIIQEVVNNIIKHSKATKASIFTEIYKNEFRIMAMDNGIGFNYSDVANNKNCTGLRTIKNRIHILNGEITIEPAAEIGTRINIEIPLG
jgi:PAS domain S-box-containing protein